MGNKRKKILLKLNNVRADIESLEIELDELSNEHTNLYDKEETLEIDLSILQQKEKKLLEKLN